MHLEKNMKKGIYFYSTIYESFKYDGGEHFLRKNFIIYKGKQETSVMMDTFQRKSYDQMNSQSVRVR